MYLACQYRACTCGPNLRSTSRLTRQHQMLACTLLRKRSSQRHQHQVVRAFTVTLDTPEGEKKIECDGDTYILDAADEAGLDLPYSCRSGSCGTCAAKVDDISQIDQDDNSYLEGDMLQKGYFLTCSSYPKADVTIKTNQEDNVFD